MSDHRDKTLRKNYHEIAEKNFHRGLDHRSFYFKKSDKKFSTSQRYDKEVEFRYKLVN